METEQTNQTQRSEEQRTELPEEVKFLTDYFDKATAEEKITVYALVEVAVKNPNLAVAIKQLLKPAVEPYMKPGWEMELGRGEDLEMIQHVHQILQFLGYVKANEAEQDASAADEKRSKRDLIEEQVKQWLLNRPAETKMACLLIDVMGIDDYNTKDFFMRL